VSGAFLPSGIWDGPETIKSKKKGTGSSVFCFSSLFLCRIRDINKKLGSGRKYFHISLAAVKCEYRFLILFYVNLT
jgi:hypothetical protein